MRMIDADALLDAFAAENDAKECQWTLYGIKRKIEDAPRQEPCEDATLRDIFCMGCEYKEQELNTGHWIPVSEMLPKYGEEVLVSGYDTYNKKVIISKYQGEKYGFTCGLVSAWMPLPKPYIRERMIK